MESESTWHLITDEGEQLGPFNDDELLALAGEGRINPENLLWRAGMEEWIPAAKVEGLLPAPRPHAPRLITGALHSPAPARVAPPVAAHGGPRTADLHIRSSSPAGLTGLQPAGMTFDPVFVRPLRLVALGLGFLLWGTWSMVAGVVLAVIGILSGHFGDGGMLGPVVTIAGGALVLTGYVLRIVGESLSINVPSASGAKGFIIACLCCEVGGLLISMAGIPLGLGLSEAGLILIALFLRKLAAFTNNMICLIEAKSLVIHSIILAGLSLLLPVLALLVFGAGVLVGMTSDSGLAGFGVGAILLLVLMIITLFFVLSVLFKSLALFGGLRRAIRSGCFGTMAALDHGRGPR